MKFYGEKTEKKPSSIQRLFEFAGNYKYLAVASWILAAISAFVALVPFYFIWRLIKEVLRVAPDYAKAQNLSSYGWSAVGFALLAMAIYIGALICSHLSAFRIQANMRSRLMRHILTLPLGFMDDEGSGKVRKIVNDSSAATETFVAHQLPDKYVASATPVGLALLLLVFDWKLGLLCLIPVVLAFAVMSMMMGENMKKKMAEYQNALEEMSSEAVEYVRGVPVVKTFGQSVFSFKRFRDSIKKYEKWTISYTKDLRIPMMGYTVAINSVFVIMIAATYLFGNVKSGAADSTFLLNGDTLKLVKAFQPGIFDAVITDPPYASGGTKQNERNRTTNQKYSSMSTANALPDFDGDNKDQRSWTHWMAEWLYDVRKACKKGAPICLFIDWRQYPSITDALQWAGWIWRGTAVWDKGNSRPQKGRFRQQAEYIVWGSNGPMPINRPVSCLPGVFRYGNPQNRIHVTEKPLQLMKDVIQICEPGGLILDPFAGAGTTVLAAVMTGYRAVGIEVTDAYYKLGSDRVKIALEAEQKEDEK